MTMVGSMVDYVVATMEITTMTFSKDLSIQQIENIYPRDQTHTSFLIHGEPQEETIYSMVKFVTRKQKARTQHRCIARVMPKGVVLMLSVSMVKIMDAPVNLILYLTHVMPDTVT
uniref:Uncharacterized protein LOC102805047 n=1 Tax=Saccoglossus kowalevskii TaxID=10224 RepID=A0ABM0M7N9_SACKO|nr:PREDICTED: uncharacterized protein LOC102805047 [Saccoglossus kowalevskii]